MQVAHLYPREYEKWFRKLGTAQRAHVERRLVQLEDFGLDYGMPNVRRLDFELWELRTPGGLRLYFTVVDHTAAFVRYGTKDSQSRDIAIALERLRST